MKKFKGIIASQPHVDRFGEKRKNSALSSGYGRGAGRGDTGARAAPASAESRSSAAPPRPAAVNQRGEAIRLNNVGVAYMGQQRFADAERMFARALALNPSSDVARLNRAIALYYLQRYDEARALLQTLAKSHPNDARAWYNLGLLYKSQAQSQEALEAFRRAAEIAPRDADARYFVGASAARAAAIPAGH